MKIKVFVHTQTGRRVYEDEAFNTAMETLKLTIEECKELFNEQQEFKEMLVDWFYSGNFRRIWEKQGLGFLVQEVTRKDKCVKVHCYYGSSTYDSKEMSLLIDLIVQECKQLNIEIKSKSEIDSLLKQWESGTNRS